MNSNRSRCDARQVYNDYWNVDRDRTRFVDRIHEVTSVNEKSPPGSMSSGTLDEHPEDQEYKETITNAREKHETPWETFITCKIRTKKRLKKLRETVTS